MTSLRYSGGLLFALLAEIRYTEQHRSKRMGGVAEPVTVPSLLASLAGIVHDRYLKVKIVPKTASYYKTCEGQGGLGLNKSRFISEFKNAIEKHYDDIYNRTKNFVSENIRNDDDVRKLFVGKVLYLLRNCGNVLNDHYFVYLDGKKMNRMDFLTQPEFDFVGLILAAWYHAILYVPDNTIAEDTFNELFEYDSHITEYVFKESKLALLKKDDVVNNVVSEESEAEIADKNYFNRDTSSEEVKPVNGEYYANYLKNACEKIEQIKTILYPKQPISFYKIYVCNDVCFDYTLEQEKKYGNEPLRKATPRELVKKFGRFMTLTNVGGVGKSMFLRHLMLCDYTFKDKIKGYEELPVVPVLIKLKDYTNKYDSLEAFIFSRIKKYDPTIEFDIFKEDLDKGLFMFLFDALDEIDATMLGTFVSQLNDFCEEFSSNIYVLSSRPNSVCESLNSFVSIKLLNFRQEQALKLVDKFDEFDVEKREEFKKNIKLDGARKYSKVSVEDNPLLLTIKFMIYIQDGVLVENEIHTFFDNAYHILYKTHDLVHSNYVDRTYKTGCGVDELKNSLAEFCFLTYMNFQYSFTRSDAEKKIKRMFYAKKYGFTTQQFLDDLKDNLTIISYENGRYNFIHKSFQEFFAAYFLANLKDEAFDEDLLNRIDSYTSLRYNADHEYDKEHRVFAFRFYDCEIRNVIEMFHQMEPAKAERVLFYPILNRVFTNVDFRTNILAYIDYAYEPINGYEGNTDQHDPNDSMKSDVLHYLVWEVFGILDDHPIEAWVPHPCVIQEYWYYIPEENGLVPMDEEMVNYDDPGRGYIKPDGITYRVYDLGMVDKNFDENKNFIEVLNDSYREEYNALYKLWDKISKDIKKTS